jgi:hypothetical protein
MTKAKKRTTKKVGPRKKSPKKARATAKAKRTKAK